MITTYHRPQTLDEALKLLTQPNTFPLGGGTLLSQPTTDPIQVVDLQSLGLDSLTKKGNDLEIGATCTLQSLLESEYCPEALKVCHQTRSTDQHPQLQQPWQGHWFQAMDVHRLQPPCLQWTRRLNSAISKADQFVSGRYRRISAPPPTRTHHLDHHPPQRQICI